MFRNFRVQKDIPKTGPDPIVLALSTLAVDSTSPVALRSLNELHENIKQRIYRALIPPPLMMRFDVDPITWLGPGKSPCVQMMAEGTRVRIVARSPFDPQDPFFEIELSDNTFNSIDLDWFALNDPESERFAIDMHADGTQTMLGAGRRNLQAEEQAMTAGLSPSQIREGLRSSHLVFHQIETFLIALGHQAISLEPLTYSTAWIFERRGFAYMRGHQLMRTIHEEFQPGGSLHRLLDGSTPFRQPEQWNSVRGRAWAIRDGILKDIDKRWDDLRMTKQIGRHAGVNSAPGVIY